MRKIAILLVAVAAHLPGATIASSIRLDDLQARAMAVDPSGNVYLVGSIGTGAPNCFVAKIAPDGRVLYTSGILSATCTAIAVDRSGNVYTVGTSTAPETLPISTGALASRATHPAPGF